MSHFNPMAVLLLITLATPVCAGDKGASGESAKRRQDAAQEKNNKDMLEKSRQAQRESPHLHRETKEYRRSSPAEKEKTDQMVQRAQTLRERYQKGELSGQEWQRQHQMPVDRWKKEHDQ